MKPTVLFLSVLGCVTAIPGGYYHQEYNYKTSSSSFKNNELQHKTDDQGYVKRDGDLEGKTRPRVDANSEHSEYVNPNLRNSGYNTGLAGGASGDLSSYGHMSANVGSYGSRDLSSEGLARADHLVGTKSGAAYSGYSGSYGSNSYGSQSYGTSSNLRSITSQLQQELERDLQNALQEQRAYSQSRTSVAELERELRQNLTNRLNSELANRYGQQSIRQGLSYTISGGRLHSTANYDNQELDDLKTQLENNLLNRLRTQYSQSSYQSSQNNYQSNQNNYAYSSTARPVYYYQEPYRPATTIRPTYSVGYIPASQIRYTHVPNPESITNIASSVQNQLDAQLNQLLEDAQRRYFSSSSSYSQTNANVVLENLRNELRNNITYLLNENLKSNYGNQIQRDGHMYTVGPSGQTSSQYNYAIRDLDNLRSQVERNLIEKLNRDFETQRSRWYQQSSQHSSSHIQHGSYVTPSYDAYSTARYIPYHPDVEYATTPSSSYIVPLITNGGSGSSSSSNRQYNLVAGSRQSGYEISGGGGGSSISELQSRLQQDLSRQLQAAISKSQYGSYSSSGSYNAPNYQSSLQELSNELNRNLTRQLQEYSASGYYSSHGNYDQAQLDSLRNQLQSNLMRQLQQGLQQSFQSSSSYSSSSSSSSSNGNYRPVRGFDNYQSGQYRSGGNVLAMSGPDCVGDDPNAYTSHRMKRSYPPYRSRPLGLGQSANVGYSGSYGFSGGYGHQQPLGQQVDDSDLTQQVEEASFERLQHGSSSQQQVDDSGIGSLHFGSHSQQQVSLGQQVDDSDLTQQVEDQDFGRLQVGAQSQQQVSLGQQVDDSDLTQQVEDQHFGRLQLGAQNQHQTSLGQQVDDSDLTQQVEDQHFGRFQVGAQSQQQVGHQVDDSEQTQQVQYENLGQLQLGSHGQQQVDDDRIELTQQQQVQDSSPGKLQIGSQYQVGYGQQVDDSELTQQVQHENFGQLQLGSHGQQQVDDDVELTQQVQDPHPGKLQFGSQYQVGYEQQVDDSDLTQQVQHENFGQLQLGSHGQQQVDDDAELTQQVQDSHPGKLQLGSQYQVGYGQRVDDSTQQVEGLGNLQLSSQDQQQDLTQQVQEENFGKLQFGSQNQIDQGQQTDDSDLTQQVEDSNFGKLQIGSQTQHQVDQSQDDLTQQVENVGLGNLHLGSQGSQQIQIGQVDNGDQQVQQSEDIANSDLTQQVEEVNFGGQTGKVDNPDLTGQVGGTGLGKLRPISQNQQRIRYGSQISGSSSNYPERQQYTPLGQEEDNSELSQQVENKLTDTTQTGPLQNTQQREDFGSFTSQGQINLGHHQTSNNRLLSYNNNNRVGFNFNTNQREAATQLEDELSRQLKDAVKNYYSTSYSHLSNYESTYADLVRELERNLTQQLQSVRPTGSTRYTYSFVFSGPQKDLLKTQLENDLKLKLQHELSAVSNQQQINQEKSNIELNQNNDVQSQTQEDINSDLTQQQQHGFEIGNIEVGGQQQTRGDQLGDLTQQEEYDQQQGGFGQGQLSSNALIDSNNRGRLELQTQQVEQGLVGNPNDLTQHVDTSHHGNLELTGQQQIVGQYPQRPNPLLTQTQFGSSGRLQFGRRPVNQRPADNTNFIDTEITQQQQLYPNQNVVNQQYSNNNKPNLPTLNQVIQQQQASEEASTDVIEPLYPTNNLNQQEDTDGQQQENVDLSLQSQNSADQIQSGSEQNIVKPGFSINKPPSYSQVLQGNRGYTSSGSVTLQTNQQSNSFNQDQDSLNSYLNYQQIQSAHQLEHDLLRRLRYEISQTNYKISQSTPTDEIRQQYSQQLQRYIPDLLEKVFNEDGHAGYSSYSRYNINSLSPEQKDKLQRKLLADLSTHLQQNIQVSYSQGGIGQNSFGSGTQYQSSGSGPYTSASSNHQGYTTHQLNYGQQDVIPDSDTVSELQPSQPERATVVHNVEPQVSNYNIGIKGSRRYRVNNQNTVDDTEVVQPQSEDITPSSETPDSVPQEVAGLNETPPPEQLPWWKRVGNKISQGASNLKAKIIG